MTLTIDSDSRTCTVTEAGLSRQLPLYSREAFEMLSREWVRVGWAVQYYFAFRWMGRPVLQLPEDLVRLQEAVCALEPEVIIETGIYDGGSLLFHATLCEAMGKGRVIGIDQSIGDETRRALATHRLAHRIFLIEGDSTAPETIAKVRELAGDDGPVMIVLDSHHARAHVAKELEAYAPMVSAGSCIVAADGIMRDLADVPGGEAAWVEDNPACAVRDFLTTHPEFELRDAKSVVTYWRDGWLWRKS